MTALRPERASGAGRDGPEAYDAAGGPYSPAPYDTRGSAAPYDTRGSAAPYAGHPHARWGPSRPSPDPSPRQAPPVDDETVALRIPDPPPVA
ncbi:class E sortase, partial [Kitasatospora sp. NPDC018614]